MLKKILIAGCLMMVTVAILKRSFASADQQDGPHRTALLVVHMAKGVTPPRLCGRGRTITPLHS
jgi:hypothetical protein